MSSVPEKDPEELAESAEESREQGIDWKGVVLAMVVTVAALFGLQEWYRTYSLVNQPDYSSTEIGAQVAALRAAQTEALERGTMPIDRAMRTLAERGRTASALITPEASTDPAPAAGWMHHPAYEAPPTLEAQAEPEPEEAIEEEEGAAPETGVEPAPAPAGEPAPATEPAPAAGQPAAPAGEPAAPPRPRGAEAPAAGQPPAAGAAQAPTKRAPTPTTPPPPAPPAPAQ